MEFLIVLPAAGLPASLPGRMRGCPAFWQLGRLATFASKHLLSPEFSDPCDGARQEGRNTHLSLPPASRPTEASHWPNLLGACGRELGEADPWGGWQGTPALPPWGLTPWLPCSLAGACDPPSNSQSLCGQPSATPAVPRSSQAGPARRVKISPRKPSPLAVPTLSLRYDPGVSPLSGPPRTGSRGCGLMPGLRPHLRAQVSGISAAAEPPGKARGWGFQPPDFSPGLVPCTLMRGEHRPPPPADTPSATHP